MSALFVFFLLFAGSYLNGMLLVRHLRCTHHLLWSEMGEPTLSQSNLGAPRLRLMKFVWRLEFLKLRDFRLNFICFAAMLLEVGLLVAIVRLMVR